MPPVLFSAAAAAFAAVAGYGNDRPPKAADGVITVSTMSLIGVFAAAPEAAAPPPLELAAELEQPAASMAATASAAYSAVLRLLIVIRPPATISMGNFSGRAGAFGGLRLLGAVPLVLFFALAEVRGDDRRVAQHLVRRPRGDGQAEVQRDDAVRHAPDQRYVVLDQHHGDVPVAGHHGDEPRYLAPLPLR